MQTLLRLKESFISGALVGGLVDDPDCLAEMEHTYSVFRFRYVWGTVYELTFSNLAEAEERGVCFALLPPLYVWLDSLDTDTLGVGHNGVVFEVTHRFVVRDTDHLKGVAGYN